MKLVFESLEELHAFYGEAFGDSGEQDKPKRTRRSKKDDAAPGDANQAGAVQAPTPMQPPQGSQQPNGGAAFSGFAPPAGGAGPGPGFGAPAAAAPAPTQHAGPSPEITELARRIKVRVDAALASGQNGEAALTWFRTECGPNAAQATMEQIMGHHLLQQTKEKLEHIAKVMAA